MTRVSSYLIKSNVSDPFSCLCGKSGCGDREEVVSVRGLWPFLKPRLDISNGSIILIIAGVTLVD